MCLKYIVCQRTYIAETHVTLLSIYLLSLCCVIIINYEFIFLVYVLGSAETTRPDVVLVIILLYYPRKSLIMFCFT